MDNTALFKLGYGLYVLTANTNGKDNGCIINTVMQVTSTQPAIAAIAVNKQNHTHDMLVKARKFNVSVLTVDTPFEVFLRFGFKSGAEVDKFADITDVERSENGLLYLPKYSNAYLSFEVIDRIDFDSHTLFKANITNAKSISKAESLTYAHYHKHIKPKPQAAGQGGWRCNVCAYVYAGEDLPSDFVCPLCKHGASDFSKIITE
jgi:flavin reductase (DIM6/NTAB) family NADH-FMN oxidoreductase RutF